MSKIGAYCMLLVMSISLFVCCCSKRAVSASGAEKEIISTDASALQQTQQLF